MKKIKNVLAIALVALVLPALFFSSCKTEDDNVAFETLQTYLTTNSFDLDDMLASWIQTNFELVDSVQNDADATNDFYILDIRSATDFAAGHIKGAVNTTLAGVVAEATNAGTLPILIVCYTGQTASHACIALRLSGYPTAQTLIWGMSGWNVDFDSWTASTGSIGVGNANWEAAPGAIATNMEFDLPVIETEETEGAAILAERVTAMLAGGFIGVTGADVLAAPADYFINNYWTVEDVEHYGNIKGAYRILPLTVAGGEIKNLDPSKTVVPYCWTGQTSSMVTAYLNILGYDAYSLKFGANSMIYSELTSHKWGASKAFSYEQ